MILAGTRSVQAFSRTAFRSIRPFSSSGFRASAEAAGAATKELSWNEFFALRIRRRNVGNVCSVATTLLGTGLAWSYFANLEIDMTQKVLGLDIIWIYGGGIVLSGVLGYLLGPSLGNTIFRTSLGKSAASFTAKDRTFLHHVQLNRPDPSKQSYINPMTDYYGEKIGSVQDYRRWLRDARLFTRKSKTFL